MSPDEARLILGVSRESDQEEIREHYEEAVFEQASFFMRRTFLPFLADKRIKKLELINTAVRSLGLETFGKSLSGSDFQTLPETYTLSELLSEYNKAQNQIKLILANATDGEEAICALRSWKSLFEEYASRFFKLYSARENQLEAVKISHAPIFDEYAGADDSRKAELALKEFLRLEMIFN